MWHTLHGSLDWNHQTFIVLCGPTQHTSVVHITYEHDENETCFISYVAKKLMGLEVHPGRVERWIPENNKRQ